MTSNDIPIDFVPDKEYAKAKDLMLYQYRTGTKTLGAQTLDENGRQFDQELSETKAKNEADALNEALQLKETARSNDMQNQYQMGTLAENTRNNTLQNKYQMGTLNESIRSNNMQNQYQMGSLNLKNAVSAAAGNASNQKSASANVRDNFINVLRTGALNHSNYNFKGAFDKANAHGAFDGVSSADMGAILKEVASLAKSSSSTGKIPAVRR